MHPAPLDGIAGALQNIVSEIQMFVADGDVSRVATANSHADNILVQLPAINYPFVADDWIALSAAGVAYRSTLEQGLEKVHASFSRIDGAAVELDRRLADIATAVDTERSKLTALGAEFQSQFSAREENRSRASAEKVQAALAQTASESATVQQRLSELASEITAERSRLTTLGTEFQSQFSTAQEARSREFAEVQTTRQDKFAGLMADYNQRLSDQNSDVEKLVGVIGNLGVTSGYLKAANQARTTTWIWQVITVVSMVAVIAFTWVAVLPLTQGTLSLPR